MIRQLVPLVSRVVYGVLCIAGMAALAFPVLVVAGIVGVIIHEGGKAIAVWLLSWAAAVFAVVLFLVIAYTAWPRASDWIVEWQGYALGFAIGGAGLALMALLVFATPLPLYVAVIVPLAATFLVGFAVPGRLLGLRRTTSRYGEPTGPGRRR